METSCYLDVPLADELFECIEGPCQAYVILPSGQKFLYHTYSNITLGSLADPDSKVTLRLGFEEYLRRLRASVCGKERPRLYWRFLKGKHIQLEDYADGKETLVKLHTRLVVPESPLAICAVCLHTEGEPHVPGCSAAIVSSQVSA